MRQLVVLVANDGTSDRVEAHILISSRLHLAESIVDELVHETVEHGVRGRCVYSVLPTRIVEVVFFHFGENAGCDTDHPHELGYVVTTEASHASKDY